MIDSAEQRAVEQFVEVIVRDVWPTAGLSEEARATAAWSLYATTMANLTRLVLERGSPALQASHREAMLDHNKVIEGLARCSTVAELYALMDMAAETTNRRRSDGWRPAADVKG